MSSSGSFAWFELVPLLLPMCVAGPKNLRALRLTKHLTMCPKLVHRAKSYKFCRPEAAINSEGKPFRKRVYLSSKCSPKRALLGPMTGVDAAAGSALLGSIAAVGDSYAAASSQMDETSGGVRAAQLADMDPQLQIFHQNLSVMLALMRRGISARAPCRHRNWAVQPWHRRLWVAPLR